MAGDNQKKLFSSLRENEKQAVIQDFLRSDSISRQKYLENQDVDSELLLWDTISKHPNAISLSGSKSKYEAIRMERDLRLLDPFGTSYLFRLLYKQELMPKERRVDLLQPQEWGHNRFQLDNNKSKSSEQQVLTQTQLEHKLFEEWDNFSILLSGEADGRGLNGMRCGPLYITFSTSGKGSFEVDVRVIDRKNKQLLHLFALCAGRHSAATTLLQAISPVDVAAFNTAMTFGPGGLNKRQALWVCRSEYPAKAKVLRELLLRFARNEEGLELSALQAAAKDCGKAFNEMLCSPVFQGAATEEKTNPKKKYGQRIYEGAPLDMTRPEYSRFLKNDKFIDKTPRKIQEVIGKLIVIFSRQGGSISDQQIETVFFQFFGTKKGTELLSYEKPQFFSFSDGEMLCSFSKENSEYDIGSIVSSDALDKCFLAAKKRFKEKQKKEEGPSLELAKVAFLEEKGWMEEKSVPHHGAKGDGDGIKKEEEKENDASASGPVLYEVYLTPDVAGRLYKKIMEIDGGSYRERLEGISNSGGIPVLLNQALAILREKGTITAHSKFLCFNLAYHEGEVEDKAVDSDSRALPSELQGVVARLHSDELSPTRQGCIQNDNGHVLQMTKDDICALKDFMGPEAAFQVGPPGSFRQRVKQLVKWMRKIADLNDRLSEEPGSSMGPKIHAQVEYYKAEIRKAFKYRPSLKSRAGTDKVSPVAELKEAKKTLLPKTLEGLEEAVNQLSLAIDKDVDDQNEKLLLKTLTKSLTDTLSTFKETKTPDDFLLISFTDELDEFIRHAPVMQPSIEVILLNIAVGVLLLGSRHFYERYTTGQWTLFHDLRSNGSKMKMRLESVVGRMEARVEQAKMLPQETHIAMK